MPSTITNGKIIAVIPARMESSRLPGKPLLPIQGNKPLIYCTYNKAKETIADYVIVTTPDQDIANYCKDNGIPWMPTSSTFPSGTHRVANIIGRLKKDVEVKLVVNIQCDEPFFNPEDVNDLINFALLPSNKQFHVCTIAARSAVGNPLDDSNVTKVVVGTNNQAYWFSRSAMRGSLLHCGIYTYHPEYLKYIGELHPTVLSKKESLEQLTFIEHGYRIGAWTIDELPQSINTKEDYEKVLRKKD